MRFSLFNKKDTYLVVGGMVFYHLIVLVLCSFWIYRFIIVSYDPDVFVLLALFFFGTILCDILLSKVQGFSRFLIRCVVDKQGFHCQNCFGKSWKLNWADVQSYGLQCVYSDFSYNLLYFSRDKHVKSLDFSDISSDRISFQIDFIRWDAIKWFIPSDIRNNIQTAIDSKKSCFFSRNHALRKKIADKQTK